MPHVFHEMKRDPSVKTRMRCSVTHFVILSVLTSIFISSFHTEHLSELVLDLNEIFLVVHDLLNVLVCTRDLVDDALVLAALDALRLLLQVGLRVLPLRGAAAKCSLSYW